MDRCFLLPLRTFDIDKTATLTPIIVKASESIILNTVVVVHNLTLLCDKQVMVHVM